MKVNSLNEILDIIRSMRHPSHQLQFRGEVCNDCDWKLIPSCARNLDTAAALTEKEAWNINEFRKRMAENKLTYRIHERDSLTAFQNDWEWLSQAQHYGLPTRLMDWTLDQKRGSCLPLMIRRWMVTTAGYGCLNAL